MHVVYVCIRVYMCIHIYIYMYARALGPYICVSLRPIITRVRPSPRQFVKAVIIPADLWHCIHIGRCLPPDQITSPSALGRPGARSLLDGTDRRTPWKPSISSPRYYHRLGFWRPPQIKANQHADVSSLCVISGVYTNTVFPSLPRALSSLARSMEGRGGGGDPFSPVWPPYYVTHARSRRTVIYTTDPRYIAIRHSRLWGNDARELLTIRRWEGKKGGKQGIYYVSRGWIPTRRKKSRANAEIFLDEERYIALWHNCDYFENRERERAQFKIISSQIWYLSLLSRYKSANN